LANDLSETNDVAAQNPEVVADMINIFNKARTPHEIWTLRE